MFEIYHNSNEPKMLDKVEYVLEYIENHFVINDKNNIEVRRVI